jgi:hypothetical protein
MPSIVRACLYVCATLQFLYGDIAQGADYSYARLLTFAEQGSVLHCPLCSYPEANASIYFVRTMEGLNLAFTDLESAMDALGSLNVMAHARNQCNRREYQIAFDNYATLMGLFEKKSDPNPTADMDGVFKLLYPRGDLSSLAEYVAPSFQRCKLQPTVTAKANPSGSKISRLAPFR